MNNYHKGIIEIIERNIGKTKEIIPVGHHELGRHFVYRIEDSKNKQYILKIYGKENRWCKEVNALELLNGVILCPEVINKGILENGVEWILQEKISGVILEEIWDHLSNNNKIYIIEEIGEILGSIHSSYKYDYYGYCEKLEYRVDDKKGFISYRKSKDKKIINNILKQELPHKEFLKKTYSAMIKYYRYLNTNEYSCLCHHDFSARNIMVNRKENMWKVTGVIDFEHSYPNDPYIDFTDLYQTIFIDEKPLEYYFLRGYTKYMKLDRNHIEKVRYYLLNKGLFICSWTYDSIRDYYNEGMRLLKWLI
ncbi:aminoglycoside phosphotransferase family protein [Dethiothermospora halolimnae]|uniref:aminoglycoside phosphotransferase family protein n=1 Tax=Dethiothermospora halolimnae TaxID=3114390 RepID=UPI003CCBC622